MSYVNLKLLTFFLCPFIIPSHRARSNREEAQRGWVGDRGGNIKLAMFLAVIVAYTSAYDLMMILVIPSRVTTSLKSLTFSQYSKSS